MLCIILYSYGSQNYAVTNTVRFIMFISAIFFSVTNIISEVNLKYLYGLLFYFLYKYISLVISLHFKSIKYFTLIYYLKCFYTLFVSFQYIFVYVKAKVNLSLSFNWAPWYEGELGEWKSRNIFFFLKIYNYSEFDSTFWIHRQSLRGATTVNGRTLVNKTAEINKENIGNRNIYSLHCLIISVETVLRNTTTKNDHYG
jgi:hypothetical protein